MVSFRNDYNELCHPDVLKRLSESSNVSYVGYGCDDVCKSARKKIQDVLQCESDVHFLVGGTQSNMVVISSILRPYQGVISAVSGHINGHETGAVESLGHKIITIDSNDGKIYPTSIKKIMDDFNGDSNHEHTVMPAMVYISNPTELGTIYTYDELKQLKDVCTSYKIPLFLDGARLAYALSAKGNDVQLKDYKDLVDVFYIGGTKCGAMFGEAIVFNDLNLGKDFRFSMKQKGAMLAKGFILGLQFDELFSNNLYYRIGEYANNIASYLDDELQKLGITMFSERFSNQLFIVLDNSTIDKLRENYEFEVWGKVNDNQTCIRLVVSWATKMNGVHQLIEDLKNITHCY